jgi:hypothetical protein
MMMILLLAVDLGFCQPAMETFKCVSGFACIFQIEFFASLDSGCTLGCMKLLSTVI